jgi:hypothetical protein
MIFLMIVFSGCEETEEIDDALNEMYDIQTTLNIEVFSQYMYDDEIVPNAGAKH